MKPSNHDDSARLIAKAKKDRKMIPDVPLTDEGLPPLTSEQHREIKLKEALNTRAQLDRLLRQNNERCAEERRAAIKKV